MSAFPATDQETWVVDPRPSVARGLDILLVPPGGIPPHLRGNGTPAVYRRCSVPLDTVPRPRQEAAEALRAALRRAREIALLPDLLRWLRLTLAELEDPDDRKNYVILREAERLKALLDAA